MTNGMSMKISILPDRTRMQTMKPSVDDGRIRCNIMYITPHRGCERGVVDFVQTNKQNMDDVWSQVHSAFVRAVCEAKQVPISAVLHVSDRNGYLDGNTIKYSPALSPTPQTARPYRLFNRP